MDVFQSRYYKINQLSLRLTCMWPYQSWRLRFFGSLFMSIIFISAIFVQAAKISTIEYDLDMYITISQPMLTFFIFISNTLGHSLNNKKMKQIIEQIEYDWEAVDAIDELQIVEKFAKQTRLYTLILTYSILVMYSGILLVASSPYILDIILPLNDTELRDPLFFAEYFVDRRKFFYPIFLHMIVIIIVTMAVSIATFPLFICYMQHACGMFTVIGYQLEHAFDNVKETIYDQLENSQKNDVSHRRLIRSIQFYTRAIQFVSNVQDCYMPVLVFQCFVTFALLTVDIFRLFHTIIVLQDIEKIVATVMQTYSHLGVTFLFCIAGQKLINHSSIVFEKAGNTNWAFASIETQKMLLPIIIRSVKPCAISVTKSMTLSNEIFASILQSAVSYFMALYSMRKV